MLSHQQCFSEESVQTLSEQRVCYLFAQKLKIWIWNICRRFLGYLLQGLGSGCRIGGFENQLKGLTIPTGLTCQDFQTCLFTRIHRSEAFFKLNHRSVANHLRTWKSIKFIRMNPFWAQVGWILCLCATPHISVYKENVRFLYNHTLADVYMCVCMYL